MAVLSPIFWRNRLSGVPITIFGDGSQTRSFCFIDDMIEGLVRLMNVPGSRHGPVNLGNPVEFTVRELADVMIEKTGSTSELRFVDLPEDDPKIRQPDIDKAKRIIDWAPTIGLSEGLDRLIKWYQSDAMGAATNVEFLADHVKEVVTTIAPTDIGEHDTQPIPLNVRPGSKTVAIIGGGPAGLTGGL